MSWVEDIFEVYDKFRLTGLVFSRVMLWLFLLTQFSDKIGAYTSHNTQPGHINYLEWPYVTLSDLRWP